MPINTPHHMQKLKNIFASPPPMYSTFMNTGSAFSCEIFANAGLQVIAIDCQHGLFSEDTAIAALHAIQSADAVPIARCRWNDPAHIMRLLDFGAMGIICPMINTAKHAQQFVNACRYSPRGNRSFGPIRASVVYGAGYYKTADDNIVTIAMIETRQALSNLDAILAITELDGIFVGPNDLSIDLGHPPLLDNDHPEFDKIITHIADKANAKGKVTAVFVGDTQAAEKRIEQGYNFIIVSNDATILKQQAAKMAADMNNLYS